jgi:hypothetical protein
VFKKEEKIYYKHQIKLTRKHKIMIRQTGNNYAKALRLFDIIRHKTHTSIHSNFRLQIALIRAYISLKLETLIDRLINEKLHP